MWLDYVGLPLKWHYPIGVLFDLYASQLSLPWSLSVHFQGFPSQTLLRCAGEETVKSHFVNSLKEVCSFLRSSSPFFSHKLLKANYLKHGDNSKVNALSLSEQNDLWEGLRKSK
jgi:hypothetical protein